MFPTRRATSHPSEASGYPARTASATHQANRRAGGGRGGAASSPAGHRHLHPRGRDGRAQLVQVADARSAGVAAVHLGRRRRGLVRRPHPELGPTEGSEPSSRQTGMGVEGGGRGRRAEAARGEEEGGGGGPAQSREGSASQSRPRPRPPGKRRTGLRAALPPPCRQQAPAGDTPGGFPRSGCQAPKSRRATWRGRCKTPDLNRLGARARAGSAPAHPLRLPGRDSRLLSIRCGRDCHAARPPELGAAGTGASARS